MSLNWYISEVARAARSQWRSIRAALIVALTWAAIGATNENIGPHIEGRLWPVIVGTDITRALPQPDGSTIFYGRATKLRLCSFDHVEWFWRAQDGMELKVPVHILEPSKIRRAGGFEFGPWQVPLSKSSLLHESYAVVWHRCHMLGLTASRFYP